jgi:serine/arginine repetitive matrix protein 2
MSHAGVEDGQRGPTTFSGRLSTGALPRLSRPPSQRGDVRTAVNQSRPALPRRVSSQLSAADDASPAMVVDSWRSKAQPRPPPPAPKQVSESPSLPPPPLMNELDSLMMKPGEDIEEVDFTELGKFIGGDAPTDHPQEQKMQRPTAADFFEAAPKTSTTASGEPATWRRAARIGEEEASAGTTVHEAPASVAPLAARPGMNLEIDSELARKANPAVPSPLPLKPSTNGTHLHLHSHPQTTMADSFAVQRSPRSATFREASMSALDDVMSRIKGAINGMHQHSKPLADNASEQLPSRPEPSVPPPGPEKPKWVPPALRPNPPMFRIRQPSDEHPREVFDVTREPPPKSPKPAWNTFTVRLPKRSIPMDPVPKKQINLTKNAGTQVRWEILSFVPPVEGMTKRDLSVNDVLFKPQILKGNIKYRVRIPKSSPRIVSLAKSAVQGSGPRVNLPVNNVGGGRPNSNGAFGKPRVADESGSWRKPLSTPVEEPDPSQEVLNPVSRSPPPELQRFSAAETKQQPFASAPEMTHSRRGSQPKMPEGSAVGFYRDSKLDSSVASSVNFTVRSELEENGEQRPPTPVPAPSRADLDPPVSSRLPSARMPIVPLPTRLEGVASAEATGVTDTTARIGDHKSTADTSVSGSLTTR